MQNLITILPYKKKKSFHSPTWTHFQIICFQVDDDQSPRCVKDSCGVIGATSHEIMISVCAVTTSALILNILCSLGWWAAMTYMQTARLSCHEIRHILNYSRRQCNELLQYKSTDLQKPSGSAVLQLVVPNITEHWSMRTDPKSLYISLEGW